MKYYFPKSSFIEPLKTNNWEYIPGLSWRKNIHKQTKYIPLNRIIHTHTHALKLYTSIYCFSLHILYVIILLSHRKALKLEASTNIFFSSTHNICEYNGLTHKTILGWKKRSRTGFKQH